MSVMVEDRAGELLHALAGPEASFRPGQLEAIRDLVGDRARVLCVQRTGWGKSAVYFIATALLREQGAGPALIISPLLALMRNQIAAAERLGIRAHTINSTNRDAWAEVEDLLARDAVDLLLISPERLNNPQFRDRMLPLFAARVGLVVVDEAHCVSDWGHDFRPDYRRLAEMLAQLPAGVAVLGTTATANDRVVADVEEQLRAGGSNAGPLRTYRGPLGRSSLRLEVVELPAQADRLAWLATWLPRFEGSGIVYTLTKRDADIVAQWLVSRGISAEAYSGEVEAERRIAVEERLLADDVKAVVATSALGMGYDKPDLGFVVHYQAPGSVIAYYQQVGRAGRGVDHADVVLLRGAEDRRIQDFFIEQAFPRREYVDRVLEALGAAGTEGLSTPSLTGLVNLGRGRIEAMLKVLDVEGAVVRSGRNWALRPGSDWHYDAERYAAVTELRRHEQTAMAAFGADGRCLMRALQEELDDPDPRDCGRCAVCAGARFDAPLDPGLVRTAALHLRAQPIVLEVKKMAPSDDGAMRKIPDDVRAEEGRALARLGDGGWDPLVQAGRRGGAFDDELVDAAAESIRRWGVPVGWVTAVPSSRSGELVPGFAERLAAALVVPYAAALERVQDGPPQREMANSAQQVANVRGRFAVTGSLPDGPCLLVDDVRYSGWTLAMLAGQLRRRGVAAVYPFALASAI
jgi:ATP-dependent DNA helicase RecQ